MNDMAARGRYLAGARCAGGLYNGQIDRRAGERRLRPSRLCFFVAVLVAKAYVHAKYSILLNSIYDADSGLNCAPFFRVR